MRILLISSHGNPRNERLWSGTPSNLLQSLQAIEGLEVETMFTLKSRFLDVLLLGIETIFCLGRRRSAVRHLVTSFALFLGLFWRLNRYSCLLFFDIEGNPGILPKRRETSSPKFFRLLDSTEAQWSLVHGHFSPNNLRKFNRLKVREKRISQNFDGFFVLTQATKESLFRDYGIEPRKISIVRTGSGQKLGERRNPVIGGPGKKRVLLTVAKGEHWRKGIDIVLELFSKNLLNSNFELRAILGKEFKESIPRGVRKFETVSLKELILNYQLADYFVLPCRFEPYGLVFLEAVRMGLPIITTVNSGLGFELIKSGWPGTLVESDAESLAKGVRALEDLEQPMQSQLVELQKKILETFSWSKMASDIVAEWSVKM